MLIGACDPLHANKCVRPVLVFRTCGDSSFFAAMMPSVGVAFSGFAGRSIAGNILCTINMVNWGRRHSGLTELQANDDHPLSKVAPGAGAGQTARRTGRDEDGTAGQMGSGGKRAGRQR